MIDIRSLYGRVAFYRPDLEQAYTGNALRNICRKVCRDDLLYQTEITFTGRYGISEYALSVPTLTRAIRIMRLEFRDRTTGLWNDLIEANYFQSIQANPNLTRTTGKPTRYADHFGTLFIWPLLDAPDPDILGDTSYSFRADVRLEPTVSDFVEVDIPPESEDALVYGALSEILLIPGEKANPQLAAAMNAKFVDASATLSNAARLGTSGNMFAKPGSSFVTRNRGVILPWPP